MIDVVQDFNLVSFYPLCIDDPETVVEVVRAVDRANGYVGITGNVTKDSIFKTVDRLGQWNDEYDRILDISERYLASQDREQDSNQIVLEE